MSRLRALLALAVVSLAIAATAASAAVSIVPLPATVQPQTFAGRAESYPRLDATGTQVGTTTFRVVSGTGNCCENYLASTPDGRLMDYGGTYIHITADSGLTWQRVLPATPLMGGEGTLAVAPNGDVLGVGWDVYSGDHLQAFKYTAATGQWTYAEQPLHLPFYDRQWIAVVPGPIELQGQTYPYVSVLRGAWPSKDLYQISTDGLTYVRPSTKQLDTLLTAGVSGPLAPVASAHSDYGQTITNSNLAPLGARALMSGPELLTGIADDCTTQTWLAQADLQWACYTPAEGPAVQWSAVDSVGRLHATQWSPTGSLTYVTSSDGGRTVQEVALPIPDGYQVLSPGDRDLKANAAAGVVAIAVRAQNTAMQRSQDFVYVYRYDATTAPVLDHVFRVGLGDLKSGVGVSSTDPRFDFASVAILPDGRVATSLMDSKHTTPAVAIEQPVAP